MQYTLEFKLRKEFLAAAAVGIIPSPHFPYDIGRLVEPMRLLSRKTCSFRHVSVDHGIVYIVLKPREKTQKTGHPSEKCLRRGDSRKKSFADLAEARQVSGWWQNHYNHRRLHSSLDYQPPARFAASLGGPPLRRVAKPRAHR